MAPPILLAVAVGSLLTAAAIAAVAIGDELMLASFNAVVNTVTATILVYVTQITSRLDKEVRRGGE